MTRDLKSSIVWDDEARPSLDVAWKGCVKAAQGGVGREIQGRGANLNHGRVTEMHPRKSNPAKERWNIFLDVVKSRVELLLRRRQQLLRANGKLSWAENKGSARRQPEKQFLAILGEL